MKTRLSMLLVLMAGIVSVAGCSATAATATASVPFTTAAGTAQSTSATTLPATSTTVPATTTLVAITSAPATTTPFSLPPLVPVDPAVYPTIVGGMTIVILADGHFAPPIIKVPVGTTVEWQATDHLSDHAIYGDDGKFWGGVIAWIPLDRTFTTAGTFSYHDVESMGGNGTVIVY